MRTLSNVRPCYLQVGAERCLIADTASHLTPFYVREHSKRILRGALFNDSRFLADLNVMDYSLVVGVSSSKEGKDGKDVKDELVVGIVGVSDRLTKLHHI